MSAISFTALGPDKNDSLQILTQKALAANTAAIGVGGSIRVANGAAQNGLACFCIIPNSDAVFAVLTGNAVGQVGKTCPAGIPIYGLFTAFTLTSGDVTAYLLP